MVICSGDERSYLQNKVAIIDSGNTDLAFSYRQRDGAFI